MRIKQKTDTRTQCPVVTVDLDKGAKLDYEDSSIILRGVSPFARMQVTSRDKSPLLTYQLSSCDMSLDDFLQHPLTLSGISSVLTSFAILVDCIEYHSLSLQRVMFDPATIFADAQTGALTFIYVPSRAFVDIENDVRKTLVYVCREAKAANPSLTDMLTHVEDYIRRTAIFTAVDYRKLLKSLNLDYTVLNQAETFQNNERKTASLSQKGVTSNYGFDFVQEQIRAQEEERALAQAQDSNAQHDIDDGANTDVFILTHMDSGISWGLGEGIFTIGRSPESSIALTNIAEISRQHATIMRQGNTVFIQDDNSTNGVTVNAQRIAPLTKVQIYPGDSILIGQTAFRLSFR